MSTLRGYVRPIGQAGARNHVFIVPSVVCSTLLARQIADEVGAVTVSHQHGCGHIGPDIIAARDLFAGLATNPNVSQALIASLGCETVQGKHVAAEIERRGYAAHFVGIQDAGGHDAALHAGVAEARALTADARNSERTAVGADALTLAVVASRTDSRIVDVIRQVGRSGARVVIAADRDTARVVPTDAVAISVGEPATAPLSYVTNAGSGAQLLAAAASCGSQVLVAFPAENQPPHGFAVAPVVNVAGADGLHALIANDFDLTAASTPAAIVDRAREVFCGSAVKAELRGSTTFAIPRLLRTM